MKKPQTTDELLDTLTDRLSKQMRLTWVLVVGAFAVGGWVVKLEVSDSHRDSKDFSHDQDISKIESHADNLAEKLADTAKTLAEVRASTYTLREATEITQRLFALEAQSKAQADQLQQALEDLKVILHRQASL